MLIFWSPAMPAACRSTLLLSSLHDDANFAGDYGRRDGEKEGRGREIGDEVVESQWVVERCGCGEKWMSSYLDSYGAAWGEVQLARQASAGESHVRRRRMREAAAM